ncbi:MarR family winged helix-turn-helix transcriptional regulator [Rhodococcus sp. NPDC058505]
MYTPADRIQFETMLLARHLPRARRGADGLDHSAFVVLSRLAVQGPMSVGELTEAFGLDTSTLSRQTTAMLGSGLVQRIPDPDGGIARKFRLTEEGLSRLQDERALRVLGIEGALADWSEEDRTLFADLLKRFNIDVERRTGRVWPRPSAARRVDEAG